MRSIGILMPLLKKFFSHELLRFLITGCVNTSAGYVIYVGLLLFFGYRTAYSISFVLGILFSYYLNSKFVFKEKLSVKKLIQFPLVYLTQYILGLFLMFILVEKFLFSAIWAPLVVVIFTLPLTFYLSRFILKQE